MVELVDCDRMLPNDNNWVLKTALEKVSHRNGTRQEKSDQSFPAKPHKARLEDEGDEGITKPMMSCGVGVGALSYISMDV